MVLGTVQVAQSCKMLEMHADIKPAAGTADAYDFAIVGANEAIAALRCAALLSKGLPAMSAKQASLLWGFTGSMSM